MAFHFVKEDLLLVIVLRIAFTCLYTNTYVNDLYVRAKREVIRPLLERVKQPMKLALLSVRLG